MIGQLIIAEPKDRSQSQATYIVVRELANALEVVEAEMGPKESTPFTISSLA